MASSDSGSQFDFDVEDGEITEVDTALIREMLDELEEEEDDEDEVTGDPLPLKVDGDLRWLEEMNEMIPSLPSDEMMAWYPEDVVGSIEFGFTEYCPFSAMYSAGIPSDDLSYGYLWDSS